MWILNFEELSRRRDVYAIDLLGFGRSSRPDLSGDAWIAEMQMVYGKYYYQYFSYNDVEGN